MGKRAVYHVTPATQGGWNVKEVGNERGSGHHGSKEAAVSQAKGLAKSAPLGQVVIHKGDGTIQTEHTYGKDPYPPKD